MFLNRKHTRKVILELAQKLRPGWPWSRVSKESFIALEGRIQNMLETEIRRQPSKGRTLFLFRGE